MAWNNIFLQYEGRLLVTRPGRRSSVRMERVALLLRLKFSGAASFVNDLV